MLCGVNHGGDSMSPDVCRSGTIPVRSCGASHTIADQLFAQVRTARSYAAGLRRFAGFSRVPQENSSSARCAVSTPRLAGRRRRAYRDALYSSVASAARLCAPSCFNGWAWARRGCGRASRELTCSPIRLAERSYRSGPGRRCGDRDVLMRQSRPKWTSFALGNGARNHRARLGTNVLADHEVLRGALAIPEERRC